MGSDGERATQRPTARRSRSSQRSRRTTWVCLRGLRDLRGLRGCSRRRVQRSAGAGRAGRSSAATPRLTGVAADVPATLSLKWTYEAGESDRVVGGDRRRRRLRRRRRNGELLAIDLETGKLRWKYATGQPARRVVAGRRRRRWSTSAICRASCTPSTRRTARSAWTFKTDSEVKSSPVIVGERVADRIVRHASLRARPAHRQARLEAARPTGRSTRRRRCVNGIVYFGGCDERFRAVRADRRQGAVRDAARRQHRRRRR